MDDGPAMQSINQIRDLPHKAVVYGFEGTVSKGFPRKAGTNNLGEWSFETFVVDDNDGESIRLSLKNCPEAGWQPGTTIRVEPHKGDKGFSGLYAEDDEYKGVPRRTLLATATSRRTITSQEQAPQRGNDSPEQTSRSSGMAYNPPPEYAPDAPAQPPKPTQRPGRDEMILETKRAMVKLANLHLICAMVVEKVEVPVYKKLTGNDMSEAQRQGAASSIFIKAQMDGHHKSMPSSPLKETDFA